MRTQDSCPICGKVDSWTLVGTTTTERYDPTSAIAGGTLLGGTGLVLGSLLGTRVKNKATYFCKNCGFKHEYDGVATKDSLDGYKNSGLEEKPLIRVVTFATPNCQFCERTQNLFIKKNKGNSGYSFKCGHCRAEFRFEFTFGGKVKRNTASISYCGNTNINNLQAGICDTVTLIKDLSFVK
ncbi:MAG: hypothetical protein FWD49_04210 [Firmicutes bacterium]|nr:hypothetical protein [Bacillota bacterium]